MRKWFSFLVLILISMTFLSFSAFAEDDIPDEEPAESDNGISLYAVSTSKIPKYRGKIPTDWYEVKDGNTYLKPIATAELNAEQRTFLEEWKSSNYNILSISMNSYDYCWLQFLILDPASYRASIGGKTSSDYYFTLSPTTTLSSGLSYVRRFLFKYKDGYFHPYSDSYPQRTTAGYIGYPITGTLAAVKNITFTSTNYFEYYFCPYSGELVLQDDGGILAPKPDYTLTIKYQYENGSKVAEPYTETLKEGETYSVLSPTLEGYTARWPTVTGTMPAEDVSIIVIYTKNSHTLTIKYQYENGETAAEPYTETVKEGGTYNVPSPTLEGYTASQPTVTGIMPAQDVSVTVTYTKDEFAP